MQVKVFDVAIVKEWIGSSKDFIAALKGPGFAAPADDPQVLTKWLVSSFYLLIIAYAIQIAYFAMLTSAAGGDIVTGMLNGIYAFITFGIQTFIMTWLFWFCFAKREPPCCCFCVVCLEDWKPMHLVAGLFYMLKGALEIIYAAQTLIGLIANINLPVMIYMVFFVFYCLYAVCMLCAGLCLVKMGQKKAGVEVPGADKIGAS